MRRPYAAALLVLTTLLPCRVATALTITLNGFSTSHLQNLASDGGGSFQESKTPTALPYIDSSAVTDAGSSATADYDLSVQSFDITFEDTRLGTLGSIGKSFGNLYFRVDQAVDYVVSGSYSAVDPEGRWIYLRVFLFDYTGAGYLLDSVQDSYSTPNESFTVGLSEGDYHNVSKGSLTGTLLPGHDYVLGYVAFVQAASTASPSGAVGSGFVSLQFVPEPGMSALALVALLGLATLRRGT